jgi:hypothetical protein
MITLSQLHPDKALKDLLDGNVEIAISSSESRIAKVYGQGERPNTNLGDEFIDVLYNGTIRAMTKPMSVYRGNLAITMYCKAQSDGTSKSNRLNSMLSQVESLVNNKASGKYFFEIPSSNVIIPASYNSATGYTTIVVNIEFRTTE